MGMSYYKNMAHMLYWMKKEDLKRLIIQDNLNILKLCIPPIYIQDKKLKYNAYISRSRVLLYLISRWDYKLYFSSVL